MAGAIIGFRFLARPVKELERERKKKNPSAIDWMKEIFFTILSHSNRQFLSRCHSFSWYDFTEIVKKYLSCVLGLKGTSSLSLHLAHLDKLKSPRHGVTFVRLWKRLTNFFSSPHISFARPWLKYSAAEGLMTVIRGTKIVYKDTDFAQSDIGQRDFRPSPRPLTRTYVSISDYSGTGSDFLSSLIFRGLFSKSSSSALSRTDKVSIRPSSTVVTCLQT